MQEMFERETGIPFDPTWIVDGGRYGDVNYPPQPECLTWMAFHRKRLEEYARKAFDVAHKHGVTVRVFCGLPRRRAR